MMLGKINQHDEYSKEASIVISLKVCVRELSESFEAVNKALTSIKDSLWEEIKKLDDEQESNS